MLLDFLTGVSDFMWGTWMTVLLVGTGVCLSVLFGFRYNFRNIRFHFRNTFGKMFDLCGEHGGIRRDELA